MGIIPVWQMVKEAATNIGGSAISIAEIRKYISDHYGSVNEGTINLQTLCCCVNRQGRVSMPENHKPRIANGRYDFLFYVGRGIVTIYDPMKHGIWEIADENGKRFVRQIITNIQSITPSQTDVPQALQANLKERKRPDIESPSIYAVKKYIDKWYNMEIYREQENALDKLFLEYCPENKKLEDVLLKAVSLNAFYSTNIFNIYAVAKHIVSLDIDERLRQGDETVVMDISIGHGIRHSKVGKEICFYSFATKYCSRHYSQVYPIYDSYVEELLIYLRDTDRFAVFTREDLHNIAVFRNVLFALRSFYALESFNLKEIDQYLWQYAKEKFPKKY